MEVERQLRTETDKWLGKIKKERTKIKLIDESRKDLLDNIDAYISDCGHFLKEGKLVLAFEAVIWGWAILELGLELGIFKDMPASEEGRKSGQGGQAT